MKETLRKVIISNKHIYRLVSEARTSLRYILKPKPRELMEVVSATRNYKKIDKNMAGFTRDHSTRVAVVLHLFYTESWQAFQGRLANINHNFDLFVSLTPQNISFTGEILKAYPAAYIYVVPNRGRDVLPFLRIATWLDRLGYEYVLKLHSKKSPHRSDGTLWFRQLVSSLLPSNKTIMNNLLSTLEEKNTGVIGPKNQYVSLLVNFPSNGPRIAEALSNIYHPQLTDKIIRARRQYGFFAGTMFWIRLDALRPILARNFKVNRFDPEKGQIDATFAHALERVFCLVPEIEGKKLYEIGPQGIKELEYKTTNIPDWSDVYIGPKSERKRR